MNYLTVNVFKWIRGVNDAEYIELLLNALDRQKKITAKAIDKLKKVDAVEVVRCKDCRWWCTDCMPEELGWCDATVNRSTYEDWFCADGERRTDE